MVSSTSSEMARKAKMRLADSATWAEDAVAAAALVVVMLLMVAVVLLRETEFR